jgi:hypothetical protein
LLSRRRLLRIEGLEGQLGEGHDLRALCGGLADGSQPATSVCLPIIDRALLDEGDPHGRQR